MPRHPHEKVEMIRKHTKDKVTAACKMMQQINGRRCMRYDVVDMAMDELLAQLGNHDKIRGKGA